MARETKVGLLVGLAFIICFAVILSNRGREDSLSPVAPFLPDLTVGAPKPTITSPNPTTTLPQGLASPNPIGGDRTPVSPNLLPMTEPVGSRHADLEQKVRELEAQLAQVAGATSPQTIFNPAPGADTSVPLSSGTVSLQTEPAVPPALHSKVLDKSTAYTVKAGDTLFSIAQTQYGSRSQRVVDAIFAANRNVLPDADQIRPGMVLRLPKLEDGGPKPVQRASDNSANPAKPVEKQAQKPGPGPGPTQTFTWYQVRKNDRYASIARTVLGDARRWREIHELNKDKFPNPDQIREGVRIKVPQRRK